VSVDAAAVTTSCMHACKLMRFTTLDL
jgi:hypothetical protein